MNYATAKRVLVDAIPGAKIERKGPHYTVTLNGEQLAFGPTYKLAIHAALYRQLMIVAAESKDTLEKLPEMPTPEIPVPETTTP